MKQRQQSKSNISIPDSIAEKGSIQNGFYPSQNALPEYYQMQYAHSFMPSENATARSSNQGDNDDDDDDDDDHHIDDSQQQKEYFYEQQNQRRGGAGVNQILIADTNSGQEHYNQKGGHSQYQSEFTSHPSQPQVYETADFYPQSNQQNQQIFNNRDIQIIDQNQTYDDEEEEDNENTNDNQEEQSQYESYDERVLLSEDGRLRMQLLHDQEYQLIREQQKLLYQSQNDEVFSNDSYPISQSDMGGKDFISLHQYHSTNQQPQHPPQVLNVSSTHNKPPRFQLKDLQHDVSQHSNVVLDYDQNNYDFLSQTHDSSTSQLDQIQEQIVNEDEMLDESQQRMFSESLGVEDSEFKENLNMLYQRRIKSSQTVLDSLQIQYSKLKNYQDYVQNLRTQLQTNKNSIISQLKIRHHMLVLKLDSLLETAMEEVFTSEQQSLQFLDSAAKQCQDKITDIEVTSQMVGLKMKAEKKTKFVQFYPDMIKQCERIMSEMNIEELDSNIVKLQQPEFDYVIVKSQEQQQQQKFDNMVIDKSIQCQLCGENDNTKKTIEYSKSKDTFTRKSSVDDNELDEQALAIRKQLKTLRKETECAKKLILNEKKLDHLLGVLDRSKEQIYRQSIDAFEQNQSIITDSNYSRQCNAMNGHHPLTTMGTMLSYNGEPLLSQRSSKNPQSIQPLQSARSNNHSSRLFHGVSQNASNMQSINVNESEEKNLKDRRQSLKIMPSYQQHQNQAMNIVKQKPISPIIKIEQKNHQNLMFNNLNSKRNLSHLDFQRPLGKENQSIDYQQPIFSPLNQNNLSIISSSVQYQNTYAGDYFDKLSKRSASIINDQTKTDRSTAEKQPSSSRKLFKFSNLRVVGSEQDKLSTKKNALRIYLPFGEVPYLSFYEAKIKLNSSVKASSFLNKLLKHAKIPHRERKRFFLTVNMENQQERIILNNEDMVILVKNTSFKPVSLLLKESIQ